MLECPVSIDPTTARSGNGQGATVQRPNAEDNTIYRPFKSSYEAPPPKRGHTSYKARVALTNQAKKLGEKARSRRPQSASRAVWKQWENHVDGVRTAAAVSHMCNRGSAQPKHHAKHSTLAEVLYNRDDFEELS